MTEFLVGDALAERIREICSIDDVDCAVAFWGIQIRDDLFPNWEHQKIRIICDISMGCNSQAALKSLGAPSNTQLRVRDGLHSKVYISQRGAIVSSANASLNGIGLKNAKPKNLECGTFYPPKSQGWLDASDWFEDLFNEQSLALNQFQLDRAPLRTHDQGPRIGANGLKTNSVLDLVRSYPERFVDTLFICTNEEIEPETLERVERLYAKDLHSEKFESLNREFVLKDKAKHFVPLHPYVIMFWDAPDDPRVDAYTNVVGTPSNRPTSIFGKDDWRGFWKAHNLPAPKRREVRALDLDIARKLKPEGWIWTAAQLSDALIGRELKDE